MVPNSAGPRHHEGALGESEEANGVHVEKRIGRFGQLCGLAEVGWNGTHRVGHSREQLPWDLEAGRMAAWGGIEVASWMATDAALAQAGPCVAGGRIDEDP